MAAGANDKKNRTEYFQKSFKQLQVIKEVLLLQIKTVAASLNV